MTTTPRVRSGRPRDADATGKVLAATLQLLEERGFAGLRMDDIARVSGVAKTTIYRRWPSLTAVVVQAMVATLGPRQVPETGDVEADFAALITLVYRSISGTQLGRALPMVSVDLMRQPELAEQYRARVIEPAREQGMRLIQAGIEQGRFRADTDPALVVDAIAGPVVFRAVVLQEDLSLRDLQAIGEMIMRGIRS